MSHEIEAHSETKGDPMTNLVFVDTETTSLDPDTGEIWEVALIVRGGCPDLIDLEYRSLVDVTLTHADPMSLKIGRFHERHPQGNAAEFDGPAVGHPGAVARDVARWTHGAHLVGNVVSFDEERLRKLLLRHGHQPSWHYHLVDVEALAAGKLGVPPPWNSSDLSKRLGVELPSEDDRHTALGDARWARDLYDAVLHD